MSRRRVGRERDGKVRTARTYSRRSAPCFSSPPKGEEERLGREDTNGASANVNNEDVTRDFYEYKVYKVYNLFHLARTSSTNNYYRCRTRKIYFNCYQSVKISLSPFKIFTYDVSYPSSRCFLNICQENISERGQENLSILVSRLSHDKYIFRDPSPNYP